MKRSLQAQASGVRRKKASSSGAERLPPGQSLTTKWPVLDLGQHPLIAAEDYLLKVEGAVEEALSLSYTALCSERFDQVEDEPADFHCVTGWSRLGLRLRGIRLLDLLAAARPLSSASHLLMHGADGYSTSLAIEEALRPSVMVVFGVNGAPLEQAHGGPVRVITPELYAWKGSKWLTRVEVLDQETLGFWEREGYHPRGDPFLEERYADRDKPPAGAEIL